MSDWRRIVRAATGLLLAGALIVIFVRGSDRAEQGALAVERPGAIEAYAEAGFQAVVVIGIAMAIYIGSGAGDVD